MGNIKLVIGQKDGKTKQIEADAQNLQGLKVGDKVKGELFDLTGYEFEITGGSDNAGFPMRKDVDMPGRRKILIVKGIGLKKNREGRRLRRTVAGNQVYEGTAQLNLKVIKAGTTPLFEEPKEEAETSEATEEKKE